MSNCNITNLFNKTVCIIRTKEILATIALALSRYYTFIEP